MAQLRGSEDYVFFSESGMDDRESDRESLPVGKRGNILFTLFQSPLQLFELVQARSCTEFGNSLFSRL